MFIYNIKINGGIALKVIIVILSIFMLLVFGISVYKIFFASGKFEVNDRIQTKEITEINSDNYANILQSVHDDLDSYVGMKIKITGYIYRVIDFEENQFVIARDMYINDEKSQSVVIGFLTQYQNTRNLKNGEWVELIGVIEKGKYHNEEIPIINITDMEETAIPTDVYVNPPSDTYVPTSGML